ncbi:MAG: hypothetical protein ACTSX1_00070 [Candidatus Heimdallarchaeaceae archaeon]
MAFKSNDSDTAVVKEGRLFTGLRNMKVIAINPNKAEMEEFGYKPQNEPVYITDGELLDPNGTEKSKKLRLDFFLQGIGINDGETVRTKIAFFLENKHRTNKTGNKAEWINDAGRTAWGTPDAAPSHYKWYEHETARPCKMGEGDVHLFLVNWLNIQPGDEAKLDNFDALFDGNYSELRQIFGANINNEVKVLLTVRDGKYQSVYNRYFDRATNKRTSYWESHAKRQAEEGYPIKEDFSNSFTFVEWTEPTMMTDLGSTSAAADDVDDGSSKGDDPF